MSSKVLTNYLVIMVCYDVIEVYFCKAHEQGVMAMYETMINKSIVFLGGVEGVGLRTIARQVRFKMPYVELFDVEDAFYKHFGDYEFSDWFKTAWVILQLMKTWDPFYLVVWPFSIYDLDSPGGYRPRIEVEIFTDFVADRFIRPVLVLIEARPRDIFERCPNSYGLIKKDTLLRGIEQGLLDEQACFDQYAQILKRERNIPSHVIRNDGLLDPTEILPASRDLLSVLYGIFSQPHPHGVFIV